MQLLKADSTLHPTLVQLQEHILPWGKCTEQDSPALPAAPFPLGQETILLLLLLLS